MNETLDFLVRHGITVVFAAVFVDQMGIPLPAVPWLLAAGALAAAGQMNGMLALGAGIASSLLADLIWFYLGRYRGQRVLNLLCRISLEPDSCVRRTENLFTRYGMRGVVLAKFVPGLSTLVPPLAGNAGVSTLVSPSLTDWVHCFTWGALSWRALFSAINWNRSSMRSPASGTARSPWWSGWRRFTSATNTSSDNGY